VAINIFDQLPVATTALWLATRCIFRNGTEGLESAKLEWRAFSFG
jgi:hypothetical protein